MNIFTPSPQQSAFFTWITNDTGSCVLEAVAGAGKTTTLIKALELMIGNIFFGAYNKKIAEEIQARAPQKQGLFISTMHAAGFKAWRRAAGNVVVNADKCRSIFRGASEKYPEYAPFEGPVLQLVSLAKQAAVGITKPAAERSTWADIIDHFDIECMDEDSGVDNTELIIRLARKTLERSVATDTVVVDFDDMIYAPLVHNVKMFQHDWVLIDEAQDTNESRRLLALRMLKPGGRLVAVGDRHQAIYGFTGADSDSLDLIARAVNAKQLPLNITYRCPKAVVKYAQQWVGHIYAADDAPEGLVTHADISTLAGTAKPGDAILCRFNAPLIEYVYSFIAAGVPARVEGREIGNGLKTLARRWKISKLTTLLEKLDTYKEREVAKAVAKEQASKAAAVEDKVNCLKVIINRVLQNDPNCQTPVDRVCAEIDSIFSEDGSAEVVLFSSIHKSKGREWHRVIWLQTGPSPWARMAWEQEQETNLNYVAATRAKHELVLMQLPAKKS
jgi:DNA helicase-2/ATP-dependent DNA helicase PcrA